MRVAVVRATGARTPEVRASAENTRTRAAARATARASCASTGAGTFCPPYCYTFMQKASAESQAERLARYQRTARECRDRAAHAADLGSRYHHIAIAESYDLLAALENEAARGG
jgi:hypothetical protein